MTDQHDDDGSPGSGGPSSSDPYAPPPPGWQRPTAPVGTPLPPPQAPPESGGYRTPPAQWNPQPPPYAAPRDWQPPPPPYQAGSTSYPPPAAPGHWQPAAAATWQPTAPGTWQPAGAPGGWPPAPDAGSPTGYDWPSAYPVASSSTNGFSVASFVLAVPPVCIITCGLGSLLGLIFGIVGLRQTGRDGSRGRGLAISGIILGTLGLVAGALIIVGIVLSSSNNTHVDDGSNDTIATMSTPAGLPAPASVLNRGA